MLTPLLFPLNRVSGADVAALQAGIATRRLLQPAFMRQKVLGNAPVPVVPLNLPWGVNGQWDLPKRPSTALSIPLVVHNLLPVPPEQFVISGTTRDSTGAVLANCVVKMYRTADDKWLDQVTSGADGTFTFYSGGQAPNTYYLVAYLDGTPDIAGTTVNTIPAL